MIRTTKVVFKGYTINQLLLLPPSLEDFIEVNHPVIAVNRLIDMIDHSLSIKVCIVGFASKTDNPEMNKILSQKCAERVRQELIKSGVSVSQIFNK